eukprot:COSAG02_NODE_5669_length_4142_cov_2.620084_3_plen_125_part_00
MLECRTVEWVAHPDANTSKTVSAHVENYEAYAEYTLDPEAYAAKVRQLCFTECKSRACEDMLTLIWARQRLALARGVAQMIYDSDLLAAVGVACHTQPCRSYPVFRRAHVETKIIEGIPLEQPK